MTINFFTRLVLILLTACVYHTFVIAEVFLNHYTVFSPFLAKPLANVLCVVSDVLSYFVRICAIQTIMMNAFMRRFLRFMVSLLAIIVVPLTFLLNLRRNKKCPPPMNPLLFKSATQLAEMIRTKQVTSEQVVEAYIERCKEANPYLNAIVEPRYDAALREARGIDKMITSTDRTPEDLEKEYPLLGVPMTVKESIAVEGMSNDCGTVYPYRNPAKRDAAVIRLARAAGAIPIAVTNTPQLCMNWETYNNVIGITMNPYDQKRTTGGSSGGESALISAAGSVIGVGSDIAGSLRLPPMFTGIFGHKPTPRLLSVEGHIPDCLDPDFEEYFTLGPIARYAEDLTLLLKVLRQPGGPEVPLDKPVDISKLKFYYMDGDGSNVTDPIGPDVRQAMEKAKDHIKKTYNIEVKPLKIKNIEHMWETSIRILLNIKHVRNIYTDPEKRDQWVSVWPEVLKTLIGMSNHNFICVCYGPLTKFFDALPKSYYKKLLSIFDEIKAEFEKILSDDVVLLHPTFPTPAHLHYRIYYKFLNCGYLTMFNALGLPVTQCPIGLSRKGYRSAFRSPQTNAMII
ncbi:hypothetical protein HW555_007621 [Spodoptera exigua]|uniref:Amidase domain-containing protein n=1 Tax=Spodoptera exigua TaxID=7107 RepID=A0A835GFW6_SPOEX|nr:hypothetical protein HW555_007621 [Spodoptera exigua]